MATEAVMRSVTSMLRTVIRVEAFDCQLFEAELSGAYCAVNHDGKTGCRII
jgi:hypothetical protein